LNYAKLGLQWAGETHQINTSFCFQIRTLFHVLTNTKALSGVAKLYYNVFTEPSACADRDSPVLLKQVIHSDMRKFLSFLSWLLFIIFIS